MSERALTKPQIISELTKSPHGSLEQYIPVGTRAAQEDPDFFAHLVAWNHVKGQVRDAKVALPLIALTPRSNDSLFVENALAHLADMDPRSLVKALDFARAVKAPSRLLRRLVERYLRDSEAQYGAWERTAVQHRASMKTLYARYHVKPMAAADTALFKGAKPAGRFASLKKLATMTPEEAAGTIIGQKIPFLIARGALGARAKDPDLLTALIVRMSPTELVTNAKALERLGVKNVPAARAAFEQALERAGTAKRGKATLKTSRAAEALADDVKLSGKLHALQEKQLDRLGGIEGRWLVLGDKSGSMAQAIELARQVAALLARMVTGQVHLVFFDTTPRYMDATGKTLEELTALTRGVNAMGGTSIGSGLQYCLDRKIEVDGIALVSDGAENTMPGFASTYTKLAKLFDHEPTVYWYRTVQDHDFRSSNWIASWLASCASAGIDVQQFDMRQGADYYSLPNLVQTMRVGRYALLDEVLATQLRTLNDVLTRTTQMEVLAHARTAEAVGH